MCGRYTLTTPLGALRAIFEAESGINLMPRYNIAPTQDVVAVRVAANGGRELILLRWGLIPSWSKDPSIGSRMINARRETVAEKPSFRRAFAGRRCLLPADGFYEWKAVSGGKQPYFIYSSDKSVLAFAGLWESWREPGGGTTLETCTILTTTAHPGIAEIHHRMPVILRRKDYGLWLGAETPKDQLLSLLRSDEAAGLAAHPISRRVNSVSNDDPTLLEPDAEIPDEKPYRQVGKKNGGRQGELF
jgi:putative SOS response-associated peptidase YedK